MTRKQEMWTYIISSGLVIIVGEHLWEAEMFTDVAILFFGTAVIFGTYLDRLYRDDDTAKKNAERAIEPKNPQTP